MTLLKSIFVLAAVFSLTACEKFKQDKMSSHSGDAMESADTMMSDSDNMMAPSN